MKVIKVYEENNTHRGKSHVLYIISLQKAKKIEILWQEIMKEYLTISNNSQLLFAKNSSHLIHLADDEIIFNTIKKLFDDCKIFGQTHCY